MIQRDRSASACRVRGAAAVTEDTASQSHDEWLLDEALMESFPASDPAAPAIVSVPLAPRRPGGRAAATLPAWTGTDRSVFPGRAGPI